MNVHDVVLRVHVISYAHILCPFKVLSHFLGHVGPSLDVVTLDPELNLCKAPSSSHAANKFVGNLKENLNQSSAQREVVIFKFVPFGSSKKLFSNVGVNDHQVAVHLSSVTVHIYFTFFDEILMNLGRSVALNILCKLIGVRLITNASEEFDSFLSFHFLEQPVVLDKCLLVYAQLNRFQI